MSDYSILKCIRTDKPMKKNGKYPVYLRIRINGQETKVPAKLDVEVSKWDDIRKEPIDIGLAAQLNRTVNKLDLYISRAIADGVNISANSVREYHYGRISQSPESQSFFNYYLHFVQRKVKSGINKETTRVYLTTYNAIKKFKRDLLISDITLAFVEDFDNFLSAVLGNSPGGRHPKHKNLHTVILDMLKHDINIKDPYVWFKIPTAPVTEIYLTNTELLNIQKLTDVFPQSSVGYNVLRMYLFSCYTGLRFSDVLDLRWSHIDLKYKLIKKIMVKTKVQVITPLFELAYNIVDSLSSSGKLYGSDEKVFTGYSEPTMNGYLKKYAKMAGIKKHITFHTSRHTFATKLVKDKVDVFTISKYLGHKSIDMTMRYLKYDKSIAADFAKQIKTFNDDVAENLDVISVKNLNRIRSVD